ncbi:MAG: TerB family tellurite resistance protein [Planctomycetes bacterium]|nr:TerB family tellurite resistance protein [Planctomycetota bacterium]
MSNPGGNTAGDGEHRESASPMAKVEVLRAACCVAGADGDISEQEMVWLKKLAGEVGVGDVSLQAMISRARSDKDYARDQFRFLHNDPREAMRVLLSVAVSDAVLNDREREVLWALAQKLGVDAPTFEKYIATADAFIAKKTAE